MILSFENGLFILMQKSSLQPFSAIRLAPRVTSPKFWSSSHGALGSLSVVGVADIAGRPLERGNAVKSSDDRNSTARRKKNLTNHSLDGSGTLRCAVSGRNFQLQLLLHAPGSRTND